MDAKEVMEIRSNPQAYLESIDYKELQKVIDNALLKQIPMKPFYEGDGYAGGKIVYDTWRCQNCGHDYEVDFDKYDYCPNCGQKIDWGEEDE